jgi:hypothetical protein
VENEKNFLKKNNSHFFPLILEFHQVTDLGNNYPNAGIHMFQTEKSIKFGVDTFNFKRHILM